MNAVHDILAYSYKIYINIINIYSWTSQVHPPAHSALKITCCAARHHIAGVVA